MTDLVPHLTLEVMTQAVQAVCDEQEDQPSITARTFAAGVMYHLTAILAAKAIEAEALEKAWASVEGAMRQDVVPHG